MYCRDIKGIFNRKEAESMNYLYWSCSMRSDFKDIDKSKVYFITGAAGFIGFHLSKRLLDEGCTVIGLDNLNDYYDVNLKKTRLGIIEKYDSFKFIFADLQDKDTLFKIFKEYEIDIVVNLAAQAGVRYSITNQMYTYNPI